MWSTVLVAVIISLLAVGIIVLITIIAPSDGISSALYSLTVMMAMFIIVGYNHYKMKYDPM